MSTRNLRLILGVPAAALLLAGCLTLTAESPPTALQESTAPQGSASQPQQPGPPQYVGIARCASSACHGNDAHRTWRDQDRHATAFQVLFEERSQVIGRILGIAHPEDDMRCLACHAAPAPPSRRGTGFDLSQGVSCEACHGPASKWRETHYERGVSRRQLLEQGLYPTKDLAKRAELCLSCHLGDKTKSVGHDLLAAGHPALAFELDTFTTRLPPHWRQPSEEWAGARAWAVGQATALAQSLDLLASHLDPPIWNGWPDFADFECDSCHHPYPSPSRQAGGGPGRAGLPPFQPSRSVVFMRFLAEAQPTEEARLRALLKRVTIALGDLGRDPGAAAEAARQAAQASLSLIPGLESLGWTPTLATATIRRLSQQARAIARQGYRSAEQAKWSSDALRAAHRLNAGDDAELERFSRQLEAALRQRYPQAFARLAKSEEP